jgi:hypothetical protein
VTLLVEIDRLTRLRQQSYSSLGLLNRKTKRRREAIAATASSLGLVLSLAELALFLRAVKEDVRYPSFAWH